MIPLVFGDTIHKNWVPPRGGTGLEHDNKFIFGQVELETSMSHLSGNPEYGVGSSRMWERELTVLIHTCRFNQP